ncbi:MAG: MASE1 domain-containing protein [Xanthomonadaceae bacterium]|nr:MASE1 domain-containing protein [Xanthomonadaceae bacterium]MDE1963826.1 MASE1 domain-containing protein [Xanthomonadaceae bacterium]
MLQSRYGKFVARQLLTAALYGAGLVALRQVSFSHWEVFAGFRLCVLLLVGYRYWPALLVGETTCLIVSAIQSIDRFGIAWAVLFSVPPAGLAMPVVAYCRERLALFDATGRIRIPVLILCAFACSILWASINILSFSVMQLPPDYVWMGMPVYAARLFTGSFAGVLAVAPMVFCIRELRMDGDLTWRRLIHNRLFIESASIMLPALLMLAWVGASAGQDGIKQAARIFMFVPVVMLALRHGWKGAAVGGAAASVAVISTMPSLYDTGTLEAQVFMAFATTTLLLLGDRIAVLSEREALRRQDACMALALAQRNLWLGEMQLRQTSRALEGLQETFRSSYLELLDRVRHVMPPLDERAYRLRAVEAQQQIHRLADSLHPVLWQDGGLAATLRQGTVPRVLNDIGIRYWCTFRNEQNIEIERELQVVIYRSVCDLIVYLCQSRQVRSISMQVRIGGASGTHCALVRIKGARDSDNPMSAQTLHELMSGLSASGLGLEAVRDRVSLFGGVLRERVVGESVHLGLLMTRA